MPLETDTFTYKIIDVDGNVEEVTETKVVLPPTKSVFDQWYNCTICSDPLARRELTWYKGMPYCPKCVGEEYYEDYKREPDAFSDRTEGDG